jgi:dihydrofolate reductase
VLHSRPDCTLVLALFVPVVLRLRLKQQDGKHILVNGSGALVRSLLSEGLLDQLRIFVHPTVVGAGIRLFPDGTAAQLTLSDSRNYDNGVMSLTYQAATDARA